MFLNKTTLIHSLSLDGFENWQPKLDVRHLNRPRQRPSELPGDGRIASVLLLMYPKNRVPHIVLTRRNNALAKHPGQISLPGGRQELDETPSQTALRETEEEIGVPKDKVELLGQLNPVYVPPSDFTVTPIVGWHDGTPHFVAEVCEVSEIIEVPIAKLLDADTLEYGNIKNGDKIVVAPFYRIDQHKVWGATALMLSELMERIQIVLN